MLLRAAAEAGNKALAVPEVLAAVAVDQDLMVQAQLGVLEALAVAAVAAVP